MYVSHCALLKSPFATSPVPETPVPARSLSQPGETRCSCLPIWQRWPSLSLLSRLSLSLVCVCVGFCRHKPLVNHPRDFFLMRETYQRPPVRASHLHSNCSALQMPIRIYTLGAMQLTISYFSSMFVPIYLLTFSREKKNTNKLTKKKWNIKRKERPSQQTEAFNL